MARSASWMAAARASRVAARYRADAQRGGAMEAEADDNAPYDFRNFFKKKLVIRARYQPTLPISFDCKTRVMKDK
jgi:hypothetical protein